MVPGMVEWRKQFLFKFWSCWKFEAPVISPKDRLIKLPERKNFLVERITARPGLNFKRNHDDPRKKITESKKKKYDFSPILRCRFYVVPSILRNGAQ